MRLDIASALPSSSAFDGAQGAHVGPLGILEPLELADLDEFRMWSALVTGAWLHPATSLLVESATQRSGAFVFGARVGPERWRQLFRITCSAHTLQPRRLEPELGDGTVLEVDDFGPGPFCDVPRRLRWRHGWLEDAVEITHVEPGDGATAFRLQDTRGNRAARIDPEIPPRVRTTRAPRGRLPLARVSIEGRDIGWFLLDTGAGVSAIDAAVAARLGLPGLGRVWIVTPTGGMGSGYRRCGALTVGPVTMPEPLLVELDLTTLSTRLGARLAGVLGFDLFAQSVVHLIHDPPSIELFAPDHAPLLAWHDLRFQGRVPLLTAVLAPGGDASSGLVALDTGSSAPLVLHGSVTRQLGLRTRAPRRGVRSVSGTGGLAVSTLPWMTLCGERFERIPVLITDSAGGALGAPTTLGSVGGRLFQGRGLVLDWPRRRVGLRAAVSAKEDTDAVDPRFYEV